MQSAAENPLRKRKNVQTILNKKAQHGTDFVLTFFSFLFTFLKYKLLNNFLFKIFVFFFYLNSVWRSSRGEN